MKVLVKIPSRERPRRLASVVREYLAKAEGRVTILLSLDEDDTASIAEKSSLEHPDVIVRWGTRKTKIEAINRDVSTIPFDLLIVGADDMVPIVEGYDRRLAEVAELAGPDIALWASDGRQNRISTVPVMDRAYYERDGYVYRNIYESYFPDDAWTEMARRRGRLEVVRGPMFFHNHPFWTRVGNDALYDHNRKPKAKDRETYKRDLAAGFPILPR